MTRENGLVKSSRFIHDEEKDMHNRSITGTMVCVLQLERLEQGDQRRLCQISKVANIYIP